MNIKKIKISVICPVYNSEKFIDKTILSLLNQKTPPDQIIFCDDGSTDNSFNKIRTYKKKFLKKKIKFLLLRSKHLGPGSARNKCIKRAKYEYISFIDSDDIWYKNKIFLTKINILLNPNKNFFIHWEKNIKLNNNFTILRHAIDFKKNKDLTMQLYQKNFFSTSAVTLSRKIMSNKIEFDTTLPNAQDYDLWLKLSKNIKLKIMPKVLGAYIENASNITNRYYFYKFISLFKIVLRYRSHVNNSIFIMKLLKIIFSRQWFRII
jgi:glycosyltransferase involved in cell wall biosynthesis